LPAGPALLICDEPTAAHLDPEARQALTADLLQATEGRSVLFISHQRDGPGKVGQIVVLDHGRIAERGSHQQFRRAMGLCQPMRESEQEPA
jgi:ABC-type transport system involved in cytochrome bd biosynthesis fused ATPase/permease subunit